MAGRAITTTPCTQVGTFVHNGWWFLLNRLIANAAFFFMTIIMGWLGGSTLEAAGLAFNILTVTFSAGLFSMYATAYMTQSFAHDRSRANQYGTVYSLAAWFTYRYGSALTIALPLFTGIAYAAVDNDIAKHIFWYFLGLAPGIMPSMLFYAQQQMALSMPSLDNSISLGFVALNTLVSVGLMILFGQMVDWQLSCGIGSQAFGVTLGFSLAAIVSFLGFGLYFKCARPQYYIGVLWREDSGQLPARDVALFDSKALPMAASLAAMQASSVVLGFMTIAFGALALKAQSIAGSFRVFTKVIASAIGHTITRSVRKAYTGDVKYPDSANAAIVIGAAFNGLVWGVAAMILGFAQQPVMRLFGIESETAQLGISGLLWLTIGSVLADVTYATANATLNGYNEFSRGLVYTVSQLFFLGISAAAILGFPAQLGVLGVYGGEMLAFTTIALTMLWRFCSMAEPAAQPESLGSVLSNMFCCGDTGGDVSGGVEMVSQVIGDSSATTPASLAAANV